MSATTLLTRGRIGGLTGVMTRGREGVSVGAFGPAHTISASIDYRRLSATIDYRRITLGATGMITVVGSATLNDVIIGDSYPLIVSGTLLVPGTFTVGRIMFKKNVTDLDTAALIDVMVGSSLTSGGQITVDGTSGPYSVLFTLTDAQTAALVGASAQADWFGFWEVRLTTAAGAEYTPIRESRVIAKPRMIDAI